MMKKVILVLFIFLLPLLSLAQIDVKIKGLKDKEVEILVLKIAVNNELVSKNKVECKNGKFTIDTDFDQPVKIVVVTPSGKLDTRLIRGVVNREAMLIDLYVLPKDQFSVRGEKKGNTILYRVVGSALNEQLAIDRTESIQVAEYHDMESEYFKANRTKEERDSVSYLGNPYREKLNVKMAEFIPKNVDNQISGLYLTLISTTYFDKLYPLLSEDVKNGMFRSLLITKQRRNELLKNNAATKAGKMAEDFSLEGLKGDKIVLSQLRGQYVLLYFWGSWCHWCIKGAPGLNKFCNEYDGKVKVVGIACNDTEAKLKQAINDNNIVWDNYLDTKKISFIYGVTGYPCKILINPEGEIVFKYEGEHPDFYKEIVNYIK